MVQSECLIFIIGIFATFFTSWTVPQIRKSLRTKKTDAPNMAQYSLCVGMERIQATKKDKNETLEMPGRHVRQ